MRERYRDVTLAVEDRHWWYVGRRRIVETFLAGADLPPGARILDAGCGGGGNLASLARFGTVTGLEPAPEALELARSRAIADVVQGTLASSPLDPGSFDLLAALDVVEHLDDDVAGFTELRRLGTPGARLLVTVPAYPGLWSSHDVVNEHRRRYVRSTLIEAAAAGGWRALRTTYFNLAFLVPAAITRLAERLRRTPPPRSDFELTPGWLDPILRAPLFLEARIIGAGAPLPAGLSLLGLFELSP